MRPDKVIVTLMFELTLLKVLKTIVAMWLPWSAKVLTASASETSVIKTDV